MLQPFVCVLVNIDWNTLQELSSLHLMDIGHLAPTMGRKRLKTIAEQHIQMSNTIAGSCRKRPVTPFICYSQQQFKEMQGPDNTRRKIDSLTMLDSEGLLSAEEQKLLHYVFDDSKNEMDIVVSMNLHGRACEVGTRRDMRTLKPGSWLSDTISVGCTNMNLRFSVPLTQKPF
ncbi:uncharacterized protein LOC114272041 [Camellia sinensis]|uniref:uncharacterized protein LOC114272041 n=1 Tax=Camellia sinensis TaxID=4442 RepID=UPI001035C81E|nr:uncharacterized protein LOC114272041 [Camellia sinensis]